MFDLTGNSGGGIFADSIDWGSALPAPAAGQNTASSGGWSWGGFADVIGAAANGYANVLAAGQVQRNSDAISTATDRDPSQDYQLRVPQQVGFQLNTGMVLLLVVAVGAVVLLKD